MKFQYGRSAFGRLGRSGWCRMTLRLGDWRVPRDGGVGILQEYPSIFFFLRRRNRIARFRGGFSKGSQESSFEPQSNHLTLAL